MEHYTFNFTGRARREKLHGREFLVVPLTMIVPGVLNGSQGALFYPPSEIKRNSQAWNGIPLTVGHPTRNGQQLSGRDPSVLNETGVGFVFHVRSESGKLKGEGWFDVEAVRKVDNRIYDAIINGRKMELSTGLFTDNHPATPGSSYNGRPYTHVARNYRPDHLAILPDQVGACSVEDGCGVNVNIAADQEECSCGGQCDECKAGLEENQAEGCTCDTSGPEGCPVHGDTEKVTNSKQVIWNEIGKVLGILEAVENGIVQPHSKNTGRFKSPSAGTGKGPVHEAAQRGALALDPDDHAKGASAKAEADVGTNPASWVEDEDIWDRAKKAADAGEYDADTYWAVVSHIYKRMGGKSKSEGTTDNADDDCQWVTASGTPICIKGGEVKKGPSALKKAAASDGKKSSHFKTKDRDEVAQKEGFRKHSDKQKAQDKALGKANKDAMDKDLGDLKKELFGKQGKAQAAGEVHKRDPMLTVKGAAKVIGKHLKSGLSKAGALADMIGTKLLGKDDFEAIKNIPDDVKSRFRNLFKKGKFTSNGVVAIHPVTLECLVEMGLVYNARVNNAFCPTGPGGGQDNSCSRYGDGGSSKEKAVAKALSNFKIKENGEWSSVKVGSRAYKIRKVGSGYEAVSPLKTRTIGKTAESALTSVIDVRDIPKGTATDIGAKGQQFNNPKSDEDAQFFKSRASAEAFVKEATDRGYDVDYSHKGGTSQVRIQGVTDDNKKEIRALGDKHGREKSIWEQPVPPPRGTAAKDLEKSAVSKRQLAKELKAERAAREAAAKAPRKDEEVFARWKAKQKKTNNAFCPTGPGGGQDNSCSSKGGGGGVKVGDKDAKGRTVISDEVASMGASLADKLNTAGRKSDAAVEVYSNAKYHRLKREQKKAPELEKKMKEVTKQYYKARDEAEAFEKKHGLSVVDAWEADRGRGWPSYKVDTRTDTRPKFVRQSDSEPHKTENSSVGNRSHSARRPRLGANVVGVRDMKRGQVIDALVSNCDCFDEEDRDTLNSLEDGKLVRLYQSLIGNATYEDEEEEAPADDEEIMEDDEEMEDPAPKKKPGGFFQKKAIANRRNSSDAIAASILRSRRKPMSADEWFGTAPPEIKSAVQNAMKLEAETKRGLLDRLTANVADDKVQSVLNSLKDKSIEELEGLLSLLPPPRAINAPSFIGAAVPFPGRTTNEQAISNDDDDVLPLPTINYADEFGTRRKTATVS